MKKLAQIFLILVLVSSCNNPFSVRINANYYPINEGDSWIYRVKNEFNYTTTVEVTSKDTFFTVIEGNQEKLIERKMGKVSIVRELYRTYEGEKIIFGTIYEPLLHLPFVEGENWEKNFRLTSVYSGDTLEKTVSVKVDSIIRTSVHVESGNYENVYRLKRTRIEDSDTSIQYEWYAPNTGLIKKKILTDSTIWELKRYIPHNE